MSKGHNIVILGLYKDNGKENGNYYSILGLYWGYIGIILGFYWDNGKENGTTGITGLIVGCIFALACSPQAYRLIRQARALAPRNLEALPVGFRV